MKSMTGFGRAVGRIGSSEVAIEVKSVNHRYLDTRFRLPSLLSSIELPLAELLRERFSRGSFEVSIRHKLIGAGSESLLGTRFAVDETAVKTLFEACEWLEKNYKLSPIKSIDTLANVGKILVSVEEAHDLDEALGEIKKIFSQALDDLEQTRQNEGKRLREILATEIAAIESISNDVQKLAPEQRVKIQEKLTKRIAEWDLPSKADSQRLEWEIAYYADRCDYTEELDRLRLLAEEFTKRLSAEGEIGRRLDFLTQEMHRELNTMGSKASLVEITQLVVTGKGCIEKLRQQVQNVE